MYARNPNKSYVDQLKDFSTTPVGAAGIKGKSPECLLQALTQLTQVWQRFLDPATAALFLPATRHGML